MDSRRQWILVISAILVLDAVALGLSNAANVTGNIVAQNNPVTVSGVFSGALLGEDVRVKGTVTSVLPEYASKSGSLYQQFMISDGEEEIKIFCSEAYGKADVSLGDGIVFEGKFQKYGGEPEVYGFCADMKKI